MASNQIFHVVFVLSLIIYSAYSMTFKLTLPNGRVVLDDIDKFDEIEAGNVRELLETPQVREFAQAVWPFLVERHPELETVDLNDLTSASKSLDYLEDLLQENVDDIRTFVQDLFTEAGMELEIYTYHP